MIAALTLAPMRPRRRGAQSLVERNHGVVVNAGAVFIGRLGEENDARIKAAIGVQLFDLLAVPFTPHKSSVARRVL
jgi:hypothetical protein